MLNRGFAETMALKRSAGLETVACWQTEAQWTEREVRDQLDALFAHRVYFATASARDARAAVELTMAEFSDTVRPGIEHLSALGHPDARLHLPTPPRDRQLEHARGPAVSVRRRNDPAARRSASGWRCTPRARPSVAGAIAPICASLTGIASAGSGHESRRENVDRPGRRRERCRSADAVSRRQRAHQIDEPAANRPRIALEPSAPAAARRIDSGSTAPDRSARPAPGVPRGQLPRAGRARRRAQRALGQASAASRGRWIPSRSTWRSSRSWRACATC